jgi:hypothetical protein
MLLSRFNEETWEINLNADRCLYRGQNEDYCKILTALFHESLSVEDCEMKAVKDKQEFEAEE